MSNYDALVTKLREIFQIDRPELDFGVYRILNARAGEIDAYLTTRLKQQVAEAFTAGAAANTDILAKELTDKIAQYEADGVNPDTVPAVQKLRDALAAASTGASEHENQVFSHLLTFFSRYYSRGDFISQRRYKGDTYAIPYSGEEVMLHWANKDQYYTKSGEAFSNYGFKLEDGRSVQFRLVAADTAKDNRKDIDKERRFALAEARNVTRIDEDGEEYEEAIVPVTEEDGALVIRFDYKAMPKGTKQDALVSQAVAAVLADETVTARWLGLTERAPTDSNPQRTILEKCFANYTQKNTADYFIHKNLGGFLRQELDFYIKNEVMNLDDVQNAAAFGAIERNLRMIQCLRAIALHLITFLASIEDFQKRLWLKKKFVVAAHYCVTLDRVPKELYPAITANSAQWAQWYDLGIRDSVQAGSADDLKACPYLMVDTALFDAAFRAELLKAIPDVDASIDGLLVHGDNFQALTLLRERYREAAQGLYFDPPYNTDASPIIYKNGFRHSSWASLMDNRVAAALPLMKDSGLACFAIDDEEYAVLFEVLETHLNLKHVATAAVRSKPQGRPTTTGFSANHEYSVFWQANETAVVGRLPREGSKAERYPHEDGISIYAWANFRKSGTDSDRSDRWRSYYPVAVNGDSVRLPDMVYSEEDKSWTVLESPVPGETFVYPIDPEGNKKVWTCGVERLRSELDDVKVVPQAELAINGFADMIKQQEILVQLLIEYTDRFYQALKAGYEGQFYDVAFITEDHGSMLKLYQFEIDGTDDGREYETKLKVLRDLVAAGKIGEASQWNAPHMVAISFARHLYYPLISPDMTGNPPLKMRPLAFDSPSEVQFVRDLEAFYSSPAAKDLLAGRSLYLLRNADTHAKGLGFARAGNFYPDFLLWVVDDASGQQWLSFVDPKGIRNLDLNDPKLGLYAEIKEREQKLNDPNLILNAFILSYTPYHDLLNVGSAGSITDLEARHVLFMDEGRDTYLTKMFSRIAA